MANDSGLFKNSFSQNTLPLYEAKMFWHYDHRFGDYADYPEGAQTSHLPDVPVERSQDPDYTITPRYWVDLFEVEKRISDKQLHNWLLVFRCLTNATNERTTIFTLLPKVALAHSATVALIDPVYLRLLSLLLANFNSLVFDFVSRQKLGGTNYSQFILKQLPVLPPDRYSQNDINYITPRVLELTYTAWDIKPFADDIWNPTPTRSQSEVEGSKAETHSILTHASDKQQLKFALDIEITGKQQLELTTPPDPTNQTHLRQLILEQWQANRAAFPDSTQTPDDSLEGIPLPPFIWHETRRAQIRAELDAYYAKLYGLTRDELRYILDPADIYGADFPSETFRVLKNNEMKKYGEYRTQRLVLEAWDKLGY